MTALVRRRFVVAVAVALCGAVAGGALCIYLGVRSVGRALGGVPPEAWRQFAEPFEQTRDMLSQKGGRWRPLRADTRSVGFPDREEKLLALRDWVQWFVGAFRRPPLTLYELAELSQPWPALKSPSAERLYSEFARACQIYGFPDDSFLLNCDGWKPDSLKDFLDMEGHLEQGLQRFYRRGDHVLLYVPSEAQAEDHAEKHPARDVFGPPPDHKGP